MEPPENELPAGAESTVLLGRTDDVAVGITQADVFTTGFRFTLACACAGRAAGRR